MLLRYRHEVPKISENMEPAVTRLHMRVRR